MYLNCECECDASVLWVSVWVFECFLSVGWLGEWVIRPLQATFDVEDAFEVRFGRLSQK